MILNSSQACNVYQKYDVIAYAFPYSQYTWVYWSLTFLAQSGCVQIWWADKPAGESLSQVESTGEQIWLAGNPGGETISQVENPSVQIWWAGAPGVKPMSKVENPWTRGRADKFEPGGEPLSQEVSRELGGDSELEDTRGTSEPRGWTVRQKENRWAK